MSALLSVEDLTVRYGGVRAADGLSFEVERGHLVAILGANGAGKSTLLRAISGIAPVASGKISYNGSDITSWRPSRILRAGIAHVPEGRRVIAPLTVEENLLLAGGSARRLEADAARARLEEMYRLFPVLGTRRKQASGSMSGGEQQLLAIGRALMADPKVLLLDEPSLGLAPIKVRDVYMLLQKGSWLREGTTVVLAEQSARMALSVATMVYVVRKGFVTWSGRPDELGSSADLSELYLGG